jgi:hypothetical protein
MDRERFQGTHEGLFLFYHRDCIQLAFVQVWVSAIEGFVPQDVIRCFNAYLDFCYIARASTFTKSTLDHLDDALKRFHEHRQVFQRIGVRDPTLLGFSLPRQHAMTHYRQHIENFGAPNGYVHPSQNRSTSLLSNAHGAVLAATTQSIRSCRPTAVQRS